MFEVSFVFFGERLTPPLRHGLAGREQIGRRVVQVIVMETTVHRVDLVLIERGAEWDSAPSYLGEVPVNRDPSQVRTLCGAE